MCVNPAHTRVHACMQLCMLCREPAVMPRIASLAQSSQRMGLWSSVLECQHHVRPVQARGRVYTCTNIRSCRYVYRDGPPCIGHDTSTVY